MQPYEVEKNTNVSLMVGASGSLTGLSRYASDLKAALSFLGARVNIVESARPPVPAWLARGAQAHGLNLDRFFATYPIVVPDEPSCGILHLASQNLATGIALRQRGSRTVITVHDVIHLKFRNEPALTGYMKFYDRVAVSLMAAGLRKASAIVACSECTRRDVIGLLGYPASRIHVVHNGVDEALFKPMVVPDQFYVRYGLQPGVPYVLYVGSEDPRKNLRRLIDAFVRVAARWPEARLLKVGAAQFEAERRQLMDHIGRSGLMGKVDFIDQVSDIDLVHFYNIAKVFVFPSLYEGFGLPALEAMSCGTPVVASRASSLPEVVGHAGLLVDPYDVAELAAAIEKVLADDGSLQAALRQHGLEQAAQFTWSRAAGQIMDVYQSVLERARRRQRHDAACR